MPPLRKSKRKSMCELLHMRDSPRCQSFSVDVPLHMAGGGSSCDASGPFPSSSLDGCHILTSTTKRGGLESQSVQELENYAVYKAEENTKAVNGCLRIAENIREDATKTLVTLHQQGEQITRTHNSAANIEQDLSRGEKLLGSLGGMFSKTWKPKKARGISGPVLSKDDSFKRRGNHMEQREKLGLTPAPKVRSNPRQSASEPTTALQKVEVEKAKQDDGLDDLSNILGDLKVMAVDMGSEIEREWRQSGGLQPGSQSTSQPDFIL